MKFMFFGFLLLLALGCAARLPRVPGTHAESVKASTLPAAAPVADVAPIGVDVRDAKASTSDAQANVRTVKAAAESQHIEAAVQPLTAADGQLSSALGKLDSALAHTNDVAAAIAQSETIHAQREKVLQQDNETLRLASRKDAAECVKTIAERDKKIADLENESTRETRHRLVTYGSLMIFFGSAGLAAFFFVAFRAGLVVGPALIFCGLVLVTIAQLLVQITRWIEWSALAALVAGIAWLAWHFLWHDPKQQGQLAGETPAVQRQQPVQQQVQQPAVQQEQGQLT